MKKSIVIKDANKICFKCLNEKDNVKDYVIHDRGYGSIFDNLSFKFQLCDKCKPKHLEVWLNEIPIVKDFCEVYKYEDKLIRFIVKFSYINNDAEFYLNLLIGSELNKLHWYQKKY